MCANLIRIGIGTKAIGGNLALAKPKPLRGATAGCDAKPICKPLA